MLNHTDIPGTEKCFDFLFLAARTTPYEEAFLPKGKITASVASLPRPCLIITILHAWNSNQSNRVENTGLTNFLSICGPDHAHMRQRLRCYSCNRINSSCFPSKIIYSTTHHLQHANLRILLQHLTSHSAYERSGGPPKHPAAKRPCSLLVVSYCNWLSIVVPNSCWFTRIELYCPDNSKLI